MTDEERLAEIGKALAAAENDPLQPACVVRAFFDPNPPTVFGIRLPQVTMRSWLALELARSPYVTGVWPEDAMEDVQALCIAISTISGKSLSPDSLIGQLPPEEVLSAKVAVAMRIGGSFETFLPLRRKHAPGEKEAKDHGTGWWIKVMVRLIGDLHMPVKVALGTPLPVAFALLAGFGTNEGMEPAGENWREREALNKWEASAVAFVEKGEQGQQADGRAENAQNPDDNDGKLQHG